MTFFKSSYSPDTPEYNDVAEQDIRLTIIMLQITVASIDHFWADALSYACDVSNMCVTTDSR